MDRNRLWFYGFRFCKKSISLLYFRITNYTALKTTNYSIYLYIILVLVARNVAGQTLKSKTPGIKVTIDGKVKEWRDSFFLSSKNQFTYAFTNDDKNLYLCIKVGQEHEQKKILRYGLIIWLDTTGGHKETEGIKYPMSLTERGLPHLHTHNVANMLGNNTEMQMKGFPALREDGNDFVKVDASFGMGIKTKLVLDSLKELIYELKIPFLLVYGKNLKPSGKELGLRFTTGKIEVKHKPNSHTVAGSGVGPHTAPPKDSHINPHIASDNFTNEDPMDLKVVVGLE